MLYLLVVAKLFVIMLRVRTSNSALVCVVLAHCVLHFHRKVHRIKKNSSLLMNLFL